jgi:heterogeneous nuclear rnp K-like protein 2
MASPESPVNANHIDDAGLAEGLAQLSTNDRDNEQPKTEEEYGQSQLTLRAIVSTKEAGVIIGKAGKNVADLREETGVKAGVSKVVQGVHDRVLTVTGPLSGISKAYSIVCKGLLEGAPQMGMGGVVQNNGTHRKLFVTFILYSLTCYQPSVSLSHTIRWVPSLVVKD